MIFFNDPVQVPDPAERAVRMAAAMRDRVAELAVGWKKTGFDLDFGIGIAHGYATLGAIGFEAASTTGRSAPSRTSPPASAPRPSPGRCCSPNAC